MLRKSRPTKSQRLTSRILKPPGVTGADVVVDFKRTTAPSLAAVSTADAKVQVRKDLDDEDDYIGGLVAAATSWVEDYTGRGLLTQTWKMELSDFPNGRIWLPRAAPLQSVTSIKYYLSGTLTTVSASSYTVSGVAEPAYVQIKSGYSWPVPDQRNDAIVIEYVVGSAAAADLGAWAVHAIKLIVTEWFDNRASDTVPGAAVSLCAPHRVAWRMPEAA